MNQAAMEPGRDITPAVVRALRRWLAFPCVIFDRDLQATWVSPALVSLLGATDADAVLGPHAAARLHPDDLVRALELFDSVLTPVSSVDEPVTPDTHFSYELRVRHDDGRWIPVEISGTKVLDDTGEVDGVFVVVRDMTSRWWLDEALRRLGQGLPHQDVMAAVASLGEAVARGPAARVVFVDRGQWLAIGSDASTAVTRDPGRDAPSSWRFRGSGPTEPVWIVVDAPCDTEPTIPQRHALTQAVELAGLAVERHHREQELYHLATRDPLTDAVNRREFDAALHRVRHADHGGGWAVLLVDLDGFKAINDRWGHRAGDQVLVTIAARLRAAVRPDDVVARLGGDEFAVLCSGPSQEAVDVVARRLTGVIERPIAIGRVEVRVGASIGVASGRHGDDAELLLAEADAALYRAKAEARPGLLNSRP